MQQQVVKQSLLVGGSLGADSGDVGRLMLLVEDHLRRVKAEGISVRIEIDADVINGFHATVDLF